MQHIKTAASAVEQKLQAALQNGEQNPVIPSTSPSSEPCPLCRSVGWIRPEVAGGSGVSRCECSKKKILQEQLRQIPQRFRHCAFENYVPADDLQIEALDKIRKNPGRGLYIHGGYGRGKTHLAVAQYRSLIEAGQVCSFRTMSELLLELKDAEIHDAFSIVMDRSKHAQSFHLFIDDIDKFKPTEWKGEALFDLFNTLYSRELCVTVTSNWDLQTLIDHERVHPAIVRRLDAMCLAVRV